MLRNIFRSPEYKNELYIYRFLLGIGGIGMILFGFLYKLIDLNVKETMLDRYFVGGLCFLALAISYHPRFKAKYIYPICEVLFFVFTLQVFYANYNNGFAAPYLLSLMLVMLGIASAYREKLKLQIYLVFFLAGLFATLAIDTKLAQGYALFVALSFIFGVAVIYFIQLIRIDFQNKLEISDEFLLNILNSTADAIFLTDTKGLIVDSNDRLLDMLKCTREQLDGKNFLVFLKDQVPDEQVAARIKGIIERGMITATAECKRFNGELFWGNFAANAIRLRHELFLLTRLTDVSDQKRMEHELKESEERYATAVAGANDGIWDWNFVTNEVYFSPRYKSMIGYADNEFPNTLDGWTKKVHPDDRKRAYQELTDYSNGQSEAFAIEFRMKHKDGHYVWVLARGKATRDEKGTVIRMAGSHTDITERKEAERLLQGVMNSSINGIMAYRSMRNEQGEIFDLEWRLINQSAVELIGGNKVDDYLGKTFLQKTLVVNPKNLLNVFKKVIEIGEHVNTERFIEYTNGKKAWYHILAVPLDDGLAVTIADITARKSYEEELKAARDAAEAAGKAKSEFLATMSHEIRTPMNGVIGMTGLLEETALTDVQRDYVETIHTSGENLLSIINDILDYSKIDSGNLELDMQPFDLVDCVEGVYGMLTPKAREKNIELLFLVNSNLPTDIVSDPTRLRQVLVNLVNNAIKFTDKGEILVSIKKHSGGDSNLELLFSVKDTGIGIPANKIDRLFKLFSQVDSSTTRKYGGTGLGLVISKRLINAMGGDMWVESEEGKGSTFYFTLPVHLVSDGLKSADQRDGSLLGKKVLLVDDNHTNLKILNLQCNSWGMEAVLAEDGQKALQILRSGNVFDLAIVDMQMPGMDGSELVQEIRKLYSVEQLPVIVLTSLGNLPSAEERKLVSAFVTKPARQSQLLFHVRRAIGNISREIIEQPKRSTAELSAQKNIRILIAEDNLINQKVALGSLKGMGYDADIATNGLEVLEMLKENIYDLIFMDVQMPEMDGLEATRRIRAQNGSSKSPLIVAMTANAMHEDREKCMDVGMDDYVAKPVKLDTLKELLNKWFPE